MKKVLVILLCLALVGCALRRDATRRKLVDLEPGMTKGETVGLLGKPYRTETLQGKENVLLIYFYWTDLKQSDDAITDDELTPLVFDNDKLLGWGWSFMKENINKYEIRVR